MIYLQQDVRLAASRFLSSIADQNFGVEGVQQCKKHQVLTYIHTKLSICSHLPSLVRSRTVVDIITDFSQTHTHLMVTYGGSEWSIWMETAAPNA